MVQYIIDSGALLAMVDAGDKYHQQAIEFVRRDDNATYFLPELVFAETMTLVKARLGTYPAVELGSRIQKSVLFQVVELDSVDREATWRIFHRYTDKAWSYADCAILAVAIRLKIREAFSFDHHIEQMAELSRVPR